VLKTVADLSYIPINITWFSFSTAVRSDVQSIGEARWVSYLAYVYTGWVKKLH